MYAIRLDPKLVPHALYSSDSIRCFLLPCGTVFSHIG